MPSLGGARVGSRHTAQPDDGRVHGHLCGRRSVSRVSCAIEGGVRRTEMFEARHLDWFVLWTRSKVAAAMVGESMLLGKSTWDRR